MALLSPPHWANSFKQALTGRLNRWRTRLPLQRPNLTALAGLDENHLPRLVQESSVALRYLHLLGPMNWDRFPERPDRRIWPDFTPLPLSVFSAACLVKIDQNLTYMSDLRQYLIDNPALMWVLGFPLFPSTRFTWGFDAAASLPTERHLCRLLREMPNLGPQSLLDETVRLLQNELSSEVQGFGECIALDTKHVIAWVKENNPKAYIEGRRYDKTQQPKGDPDCKLGCKRRKNQGKGQAKTEGVTTPLTNPLPAQSLKAGEYYWGYASGVVSTKVDGWGEFVLAELTQTFDHSDVSYFFPLMAATERRLGFRPKYGALDAAYDAFYVYEYFHQAGGFAAVPLVEKRSGNGKGRAFSEDGLPLCAAELPMPLKSTYLDRTSLLIEHERGQYVCPLRFGQQPENAEKTCPVQDPHWEKGGCTTTVAISIGARLRHTLDRSSPEYKNVYRQRTADERINSQAKEFGIERPKLRNAASICNLNSLIYVLVNLHALQRVCRRKAEHLDQQQAA